MTFTKKALKEVRKESDSRLLKHTVGVLLEKDNGEVETYINDLLNHGCQSGTEGSLIYYKDTLSFYKKYQAEIKDMLKELLSETGLTSPQELFGDKWEAEDIFAEDTQNQNLLAWFGFEEAVRRVAYELDMEI